MHIVKEIFLAGVLIVLAGCKTVSPQEDIAAVIVSPSPQSHAELKRALIKALNGAPVMIADDVFTQNSLLIIERRRLRKLEKRALSGREVGLPKKFRLMLMGEECALVDQSNGKRWVLSETLCLPEVKKENRGK